MPKIWLAPSGRLIEGHVLDCAKRPLEEALHLYDSNLYVKWNPRKLKGWGCWEVRRSPEEKVVIETIPFKGVTYTSIGYKEIDIIHHVMDVPYLNYLILEKLKKMDTWQEFNKGAGWAADLDYKEAKKQEEIVDKSEAEKAYNLKQHRSQIKDLMDYVNSGGNPARLADHWDP